MSRAIEQLEPVEITRYDVQPVEATVHSDSARGLTEGTQNHCILLHGWNSTQSGMLRIRDALRQLPQSRAWNLWLVDYETHWKSFKDAAVDVTNAFHKQGQNWANTIIVGYSMGGVVARQMIANGFPCRSLVTICSPHQGLAPWVPTPEPGTMSLAPWSEDLKRLNQNAQESGHRSDYYHFAVTYADIRGEHDDDAVVTAGSALGVGSVARRQKLHLTYQGGFAGGDPHMQGMNPQYLKPVLQTCADLFVKFA